MKHFIAYHSTEKMGERLSDGDALRVLSTRSLDRMVDHLVWFIKGEGSQPRKYCLGSVFRVQSTGETSDSGFQYFATGPGHVFDPPVLLNDEPWFREFFES